MCKNILVVRDNHDIPASFSEGIEDMHFQIKCLNVITFRGFAGSWKYKNKGPYLFSQDEVKTHMEKFPPVDIFIAHNPPQRLS